MGNTLHIYTASAGSGKTYTIAQEYLRLALSELGNYRHIQAVTFTNKATEEMKSRILDKLQDIALDRDEGMAGHLMATIGISAEELRRRAKSCLRAMLLDYGSFRISTIDSFFQEVLRSFARDLNLSGSFRLELDNATTLDAATTALFAESYKQDSREIIQWITELSQDKIRNNQKYNPTEDIRSLSQELLREELRKLECFPTMEEVRQLRAYVLAWQEDFILRCQTFARELMSMFEPMLTAGCNFSSKGPIGYINKLEQGEVAEPSKSYLNALDKPESIFLKSKQRDSFDFAPIREKLEVFYNEITSSLRLYTSCEAILKNSYALGLLSTLQEKMREIQRSNNYILLSDAPSLIHQILSDEGGVPFLYERIGTRIKHHMIDEFQDTSRMQYDNFLPLLEEALSSGDERGGQDSIIVGDVKQSIYRFRGSDSRQLGRLERGEGFDLGLAVHRLGTNWRSCPDIIRFNNKLYELLPPSIRASFEAWIADNAEAEELKELLSDDLASFEGNYQGAAQDEQKQERGAVLIHECLYEELAVDEGDELNSEESEYPDLDTVQTEDESYKQRLSYQLPELLRDIYRRGFKPCDVAILVRNKAEATAIARILQSAPEAPAEGFDFISSEALKPGEAIAVSLVIAALQYLVKPQDKISRESLLTFYRQMTGTELTEERLTLIKHMGQRSLYETIEGIIAEFKEEISLGEMPYLIKLLDTALSYQQDLSVDLSDFLEMWDSRADDLRLSLPKDESKINLMTIHKSKGLDFPIVLLPFLTWDLLSKTGRGGGKMSTKVDMLWCDNPFAEATGIPKVPIKPKKELLQSLFASDYLRDNIHSALDALNLLYVATTRAEREMHLWLIDPASKKKLYEGKKSADKIVLIPQKILPILQSSLGQMPELYTRVALGEELPDNLPHKHTGTEQMMKERDKAEPRLEIKQIESYALGNRIEELREGLSYFSEGSKRHFGSVMHDILSGLNDFSDVERVREEVLCRGDLLPEEQSEALQRLEYLLAQPEAQPWFDGSGQVRNEVAIFGSEEGVYRPDRIVTYPDGSAVVVDYKFGQQRSYYKRQVQRYAQLVKEMGYSPVNAYLWYLSGEENEDVDTPSLIQHIAQL